MVKRKLTVLIVWCLATTGVLFAQQSDEHLAAYYYDHGEYAQAAQLYEGLYKRGGNKYHYQRLLATYLALEEYKDAQRLVERRQKSNPKDLYLWVDEGSVYLHQRQEKKAIKCFDKAISMITNNQQPIADMAQAFINLGRNDYAARTYLTARGKTQNETLYFNELAGVYQLMGDYKAMTNEYFNLLDRQPGMMKNIQVSMQRAL